MSDGLIANGDRVKSTAEYEKARLGPPFVGVVLWIDADDERDNRVATVLLEDGTRKVLSTDWLERA